MSFSMIFSIIIIIAILAVAFYVIRFFVGVNECGEIGFYYNDLQNEVDKAWKSSSYSGFLEGDLPSGVESICFGTLGSSQVKADDREAHDFLLRYRRHDKNLFLYPSQQGCDSALASYKVEHVDIEGFFCLDRVDKYKVRLVKGSGDALVKVSE